MLTTNHRLILTVSRVSEDKAYQIAKLPINQPHSCLLTRRIRLAEQPPCCVSSPLHLMPIRSSFIATGHLLSTLSNGYGFLIRRGIFTLSCKSLLQPVVIFEIVHSTVPVNVTQQERQRRIAYDESNKSSDRFAGRPIYQCSYSHRQCRGSVFDSSSTVAPSYIAPTTIDATYGIG